MSGGVIRLDRSKTEHAVLGASGAKRWSSCPGSVALADTVPPGDAAGASNIYSAEGTAAHAVIEHALVNGGIPAAYVGWRVQWIEGETEWDIEVTHEMAEAIYVFVDYVRRIPAPERHYELRVDLASVKPAEVTREMFGTADVVLWNPQFRVLDVIDYKHGKGVLVPIAGNEQLRFYALGAVLKLFEDAPREDAPKLVRTTIIQPRKFTKLHPPIRTETLTLGQLKAFRMTLMEAAKRTEEPNAPLMLGDHCRWCHANSVCPLQDRDRGEKARDMFEQFGVDTAE